MLESQKLLDNVIAGNYNEIFRERYGKENVEMCQARFKEALLTWSQIYGRDRKPAIYSVPYSVLLAGDGSDVSIPTNMDMIVVVDSNNTNVSRVRCSAHNGEDNIDLYQHGPYSDESNFTIGTIRGVQQGFLHFGHKNILSFDMFVSSETLPGFGLDESAHLAIATARIINDFSFDGKLSEKELAEIVQWALANYVVTDSYATDTYSTLRGKAVTGDFTNTDAEVINEIDVNMCGHNLFAVDIGETSLEIPDEEVDERLDSFIARFEKDIEELSEKEFYEKLAELADVDKEAALFIMDYFTQENFGQIYAENAVDGIGSPTVETTVDAEKESAGGAVKWHCKAMFKYNLVLACVSDEAKDAFNKAMANVYGEESVDCIDLAKYPTETILE